MFVGWLWDRVSGCHAVNADLLQLPPQSCFDFKLTVRAKTLQRRPQVIFAKRGATWRTRVSLWRKWGRNAPASTSPTPFGLHFNQIKWRQYNAYAGSRNGASAGPTLFATGNGVGPKPTPFFYALSLVEWFESVQQIARLDHTQQRRLRAVLAYYSLNVASLPGTGTGMGKPVTRCGSLKVPRKSEIFSFFVNKEELFRFDRI